MYLEALSKHGRTATMNEEGVTWSIDDIFGVVEEFIFLRMVPLADEAAIVAIDDIIVDIVDGVDKIFVEYSGSDGFSSESHFKVPIGKILCIGTTS